MTDRQFHIQAETSRESGDFTTALELTDRAFISYIQDNDLLGASEVMCSRFNVFKHLYTQDQSSALAIQADHATQMAIAIAETSQDPRALALAYFNRGKYFQKFLTDWPQSITWYQKALDALVASPPPNHDRPAVRIDFQVHLLFAQGMAGDEQVIPPLESLAQQLSKLDEDQYNRDVWTSGAYMRLARLSHHFQQPSQLDSYLKQASQIINSNPNLTLRSHQLDELTKTLSS